MNMALLPVPPGRRWWYNLLCTGEIGILNNSTSILDALYRIAQLEILSFHNLVLVVGCGFPYPLPR